METTTAIDLNFFSCSMNSKILDLRHQALKPNDFKSSVILDKDFLKSTMHFVARTPESLKKPVCCVSYFLNTFEDVPAYQLRGMATAKDFQEMGIGERLIAFAEAIINKEKGITAFWCDTPVEMVSFLEKQGWTCSGEAFVLPDLGLRKKMTKGIAPF
jgi:GNAT superfamily N-acetyltransferase